MIGVTVKVDFLDRGQSHPALQKTSNEFFDSRLIPAANITQIFLLYSLEAQKHITVKSSLIFETHPSTP